MVLLIWFIYYKYIYNMLVKSNGKNFFTLCMEHCVPPFWWVRYKWAACLSSFQRFINPITFRVWVDEFRIRWPSFHASSTYFHRTHNCHYLCTCMEQAALVWLHRLWLVKLMEEGAGSSKFLGNRPKKSQFTKGDCIEMFQFLLELFTNKYLQEKTNRMTISQ